MAQASAPASANILLIGDSAVGKTSIVNVRVGKGFSEAEIASLGLDFVPQTVSPKSSPEFSYSLKIWDTAGQERFHSLTTAFYKQSQGMIICFDITRKKTYDSVRRWMSACQDNCETGIPIILVGNKCDLEEDRQVEMSDAQAIADEFKVPYFEVSARNNTNIGNVFDEIIDLIYKARFAPQDSTKPAPVEARREGTFKLNREDQQKGSGEKGKKDGCKC